MSLPTVGRRRQHDDPRRSKQGADDVRRSHQPGGLCAARDVKEKVSTWLQPFVEEDSDHHPLSPKGRGMQRAVGELLTCTRCAGTWGAVVLVGLRTASPVAGRATTNVLALAGANDLLQSGFRLLVERTNEASR
jgi:hypothetical protein